MTDATYHDDDYVPVSSGGGVSIRVPVSSLAQAQPAASPNAVQQLTQPAGTQQPVQRGIIDKLLGLTGPRYETWPERLARSAFTLPGDVLATGQVPMRDEYGNVVASQPEMTPGGVPSDAAIQRVQDLAGIVGSASIPAAALAPREIGALGMAGGKVIQPELPAGGVFHSAVEHALANAPQDKMSGDQWAGWLKNQPGVKQEELDWLGLPAGKQPVTKADMLAHAEGHGPQIQEVEKGEPQFNARPDNDRVEDEISRRFEIEHPEHAQFNNEADYEAFDRFANDVGAEIFEEMTGDNTKYSDYQLPGGDNYRELLLTMPDKKSLQSREQLANQHRQRYGDNFTDHWTSSEQAQYEATAPQAYRSSHWDEPNVLVHMRMNDRTLDAPSQGQLADIGQRIAQSIGASKPEHVASGGPTQAVAKGVISPEEAASYSQARGFNNEFSDQKGLGLKSLHLEEVQSDWHQAGRKQGYKNADPKDIEAAQNKMNDTRAALQSHLQQMNLTGDEIQTALAHAREGKIPSWVLGDPKNEHLATDFIDAQKRYHDVNKTTGVPDAPFKSTWADLGLKRAIAKAAREGYDAISWTPGEQQAERYDLSKQVKHIGYKKLSDGDIALEVIDKKGDNVPGIPYSMKPEELPKYIGKDAANKIVDNATDMMKKLEGEGLSVGGEGMKAFYDKMLVDKANAIGKKFGAKVEYKELPGQDYEIKPSILPEGKFAVLADHAGGSAHLGVFDTKEAAQAAIDAHKAAHPPVRVPVLRLTSKMKDTATRKGFPMFMHGSPFMFTPVPQRPAPSKSYDPDTDT